MTGRIIQLALRIRPDIHSVLSPQASILFVNLHSPERHLIELRIEHGDLNALIDRATDVVPSDELVLRRLKKKRLALRDEIARLERNLEPKEPA